MNMPVLGYVHIQQISSTVEMTLYLYVLHAMGEIHSREEHDPSAWIFSATRDGGLLNPTYMLLLYCI